MLEAARPHISEIYLCINYTLAIQFHRFSPVICRRHTTRLPLGTLLFCLVIHPMILQLKVKLQMFYLDDGTLHGRR